MPIKVVCPCGAVFAAPDELAGKAVRCPKCKQPLKIPAAAARAPAPSAALDDLFDEAGIGAKQGPSCPKCHAELKPNAILCVACGFELQTGEQREGVKIRDMSRAGHGEAADSLLARAARQIEIDKEEDKKNITHGAPAYVYLFGLAVIIAFATMMFTMPKGKAFYITGWSLVVFVGVITVYYLIRMIITACYVDETRWQRVSSWLMKAVGMIPLAILGGLLIWLGLALGLTYEEESETWLDYRPGPQVACAVKYDAR